MISRIMWLIFTKSSLVNYKVTISSAPSENKNHYSSYGQQDM